MRLFVLYDAGCPLCRRFSRWLGDQPLFVPLELVAAGSLEARQRFPGVDHEATLREITVLADDGRIWTNEHAWVMALWATATHRHTAERLSRPGMLPVARSMAVAAARLRSVTTDSREENYRGARVPDSFCEG
jgi:predicted DCC family thiol-disulfide oxidoreductase YuxK